MSHDLVWGHCWGIGANPGFSNGPKISQLTPSSVTVSWEKVVTRPDCSDHFLVKYWKTNVPKDVKFSRPIGNQIHHLDLEVDPEVEYTFQVIAREIKKVFGMTWDTDDNHSRVTKFRTSYEPGICILNIHLLFLVCKGCYSGRQIWMNYML